MGLECIWSAFSPLALRCIWNGVGAETAVLLEARCWRCDDRGREARMLELMEASQRVSAIESMAVIWRLVRLLSESSQCIRWRSSMAFLNAVLQCCSSSEDPLVRIL